MIYRKILLLVNSTNNMKNLRILHEIDRSIVSVIKDYAHKNNFPVFNELLKKLETIDKNDNTGYDESNNVDVLTRNIEGKSPVVILNVEGNLSA